MPCSVVNPKVRHPQNRRFYGWDFNIFQPSPVMIDFFMALRCPVMFQWSIHSPRIIHYCWWYPSWLTIDWPWIAWKFVITPMVHVFLLEKMGGRGVPQPFAGAPHHPGSPGGRVKPVCGPLSEWPWWADPMAASGRIQCWLVSKRWKMTIYGWFTHDVAVEMLWKNIFPAIDVKSSLTP